MTKLIAFCGYAQSGKDTAASFLVEKGFKRLAFADILRESLYRLNPVVSVARESVRPGWGRLSVIVDDYGWDYAKVTYPEVRELLQRLGTEVGRALFGENFWVDRVLAQVEPGGKYVITDVRFPNEEQAVHAAGGRIYRISRDGVNAVNAHASEAFVGTMPVDGVIPNFGSIDDFREQVLQAVGLN